MISDVSQQVVESIRNAYAERTPLSKSYDTEAKKYLPGGDTRSSVYYFPYPICMEKGEGCRLYDCDGNEYIDFQNNYTSLIHGHAHPAVVSAVELQLKKGFIHGSPATVQSELAKMLCERVPSIEQVRFTNSGSEGTMFAMRAARAVTGKDIILKMDGGYHGTHDFAEVNQKPDLESKGSPVARAESKGIPSCILNAVMVVPFNDLDAVENILAEHQDKIAAIITEPMLNAAGMIPPQQGYLEGLRALTDKHGVLLIFDEVMTLRMDVGGFQAVEGVEPDLTALGKIIGGGFAVGAFGGRQEIMACFDPANSETITHAGTFNGHPITMAAGIVTLKNLDQTEIDHINRLGDRLRAGFNREFEAAGIKGQSTGFGSTAQIHWGEREILSAKDAAIGMKSAGQLPDLLHLALVSRGVFLAPRGGLCISTPMTEGDIDYAVTAFEASLQKLRPYVEEEAPHLLANEGYLSRVDR